MAHLIRGGALLAGALVVALTLRSVLTPNPLVLSSSYRVGNVAEWRGADWPVRLVGAGYCADCHGGLTSRWQASSHYTVACEDCHGATRSHVDHRSSLVVDRSREACANCHNRSQTRPSAFPQVDVANHWGAIACVACHNPHAPSGYRPAKLRHEVTGYQDCLSCHGAAQSAAGPSAARATPPGHANFTNNRCMTCHEVR